MPCFPSATPSKGKKPRKWPGKNTFGTEEFGKCPPPPPPPPENCGSPKVTLIFNLGSIVYFPSCSGGTISLHHSFTLSLSVRHLQTRRGTPVRKGKGCSSENLNLTPKDN